MKKLSSKLYKQYYPITTEEICADFMEKNRDKLRWNLQVKKVICQRRVKDRQIHYAHKMRREVSCWGDLKLGNVLYNQSIRNSIESDRYISLYEKEYDEISRLAENVEENTVSIEMANKLLEIENENHLDNIFAVIRVMIAILTLILAAYLFSF